MARATRQRQLRGARGTLDRATDDSKIFRTTGTFKAWEGKLNVDDADIPKSSVDVTIHTTSLQMLDSQQTTMLKDGDFFDVQKFPEMVFRSDRVERTGETTLKVAG